MMTPLALVGCAMLAGPAVITVAPPAKPIYSTDELALGAAVTRGGRPVDGIALTYAAAPSDVAVISATGGLHCLKSGDVVVTLTSSEVAAPKQLPVKCRLVDKVRVSDVPVLIAGGKPFSPKVEVLDRDGTVLADVTPEVFVTFPQLLASEGASLAPKMEGMVAVGYVVRDEAHVWSDVKVVEIARIVVDSPFDLADGEASFVDLAWGFYDVKVDAKASDGSDYGVSIEGDCGTLGEARTQRFTCALDAVGGRLAIRNPSWWVSARPRMTGSVHAIRHTEPKLEAWPREALPKTRPSAEAVVPYAKDWGTASLRLSIDKTGAGTMTYNYRSMGGGTVVITDVSPETATLVLTQETSPPMLSAGPHEIRVLKYDRLQITASDGEQYTLCGPTTMQTAPDSVQVACEEELTRLGSGKIPH